MNTTPTHNVDVTVVPEDLHPHAVKMARQLQNLTPGRYCVIIHKDDTVVSDHITEPEYKLLLRLRSLEPGAYLVTVQVDKGGPHAVTIWGGGCKVEKL